jgi:hypothetical protein
MHADEVAARTEAVLGPAVVAAAQEMAADAARQASFWEADVAPLMGPFEETGEPGAIAMITAGGLVLEAAPLSRRPVGAQARARAVLDAVSAGARQAGVLPPRLHVRDEALADALAGEAKARGITAVAASLPELDEALADSLAHLAGSASGGAASQPWTWAETEASRAELAEFHAATAAFHRVAPWRLLEDRDALLLTFPGEEAPWTASVMGWAGLHFGLALYSEADDLFAMLHGEGEDTNARVAAMRGITLSMSYDRPGEIARAMRREVAAAKWELAAPDAYPMLMGIHVPGRRITAALMHRASVACRAVTAFVAAGSVQLPWRDPSTGVGIDLLGDDEGDGGHAMELPWPRLEVSHLAGPAGPNADPEAVLRDEWQAIRAREHARLARLITWIKRQNPSQAAWTRLVRTAEMWTEMLVGFGVPAESVTEFDLRMFLYGYVAPDQNPPKSVARYLTRSLARIFEFYEERDGIEYPWAALVLQELDGLTAGAEDVRDVLEEVADQFPYDMIHRALWPAVEVNGTVAGWTMVFTRETAELRAELHRRWLVWHDEAVRAGITDPADVRDLLIGRQRQWENVPHAMHGGRTPKQVLLDAEREMGEHLAGSV